MTLFSMETDLSTECFHILCMAMRRLCSALVDAVNPDYLVIFAGFAEIKFTTAVASTSSK